MHVLRALFVAVASAFVAASAVYVLVLRPRVRAWGVDPRERELAVPGDDLVVEPTASDTRGVTIAAPPEKVWPWLVQMGYERAGWYSYDALDNRGPSSDRILTEFQRLRVGDIVPTHPAGGFVVTTMDPEHALVLYSDTEVVRSQAQRAAAEGMSDLPTTGLKLSGTVLSASYPEFAASWAFVLRPTEDGGTRLIERFRVRTPGGDPVARVLGEVIGTGVALMTRKQMLGIKERAERAASSPNGEALHDRELVVA